MVRLSTLRYRPGGQVRRPVAVLAACGRPLLRLSGGTLRCRNHRTCPREPMCQFGSHPLAGHGHERAKFYDHGGGTGCVLPSGGLPRPSRWQRKTRCSTHDGLRRCPWRCCTDISGNSAVLTAIRFGWSYCGRLTNVGKRVSPHRTRC